MLAHGPLRPERPLRPRTRLWSGDPLPPRPLVSQFLLPPSWLLSDDGAVLTAVHVFLGSEVRASGELRERLLGKGSLTSGDRALGVLDPMLGALISARDEVTPAPTTRSAVLRGTGWSRLFVELTGQCNESCSHCYASAGPRVTAALDWRVITEVLEDGAALGFDTIQLTGGDPLVSPHVVPAAKLARKLGVPSIEVYTNGLALDQPLYDELSSAGVSFAFSMYSADPARHDEITRTADSHARTSRSIKRAISGGSRVRVGIVAMDADADAVERTRAYVASLGVEEDAIGVDRQRQVGRGVFSPSSLVRETGAHGDRNRGALRTAGADQAKSGAQAELRGTAAVSYDGKVHPCIFSRSCTLGDVRTARLAEILGDARPLRAIDAGRLPASLDSHEGQLACWECRLRASLLAEA